MNIKHFVHISKLGTRGGDNIRRTGMDLVCAHIKWILPATPTLTTEQSGQGRYGRGTRYPGDFDESRDTMQGRILCYCGCTGVGTRVCWCLIC